MTSNETQETLRGAVDKLTFHNEENGFCVFKLKVKGQRDSVTVTGRAAVLSVGECVECQGTWVHDKRYGMQFKADTLSTVEPTTTKGIEAFLASGMMKGVGPVFAKKLVAAFGDQVFDVIENTPSRLQECEGIGKKRKAALIAAWEQHKGVRRIMVFLQSHDLSTARAVRIYKTYGKEAIERVTHNPYCLVHDIHGIGFLTADKLALSLGFAPDSLVRAEAGVSYVLDSLCDMGHCAVKVERLLSASSELLGIQAEDIEQALNNQLNDGHLVQDQINNECCIYPKVLYDAEKNLAWHIKRLQAGRLPWGAIDIDSHLKWVEKQVGMTLAPSQRNAVSSVLNAKFSIITGGPGVGKTTVLLTIIRLMSEFKLRVGLCAPTGRAAKRLKDATEMSAMTIHRLLGFDPSNYGFKHNQLDPLEIDVLIVDEASMMDLSLSHALLKAVPDSAAVILVGDVDQLPSVGPGSVLSDLMESGMIETVRLTEIFRQAENSMIVSNAHRINKGERLATAQSKSSDFFVMPAQTPDEIKSTLLQVVSQRLPNYYGCDPLEEIQVLTPMKKGMLGSIALNAELQTVLNGGAKPSISRFATTFACGDKVIQIVNNYDKGIFNGDIGTIESIDRDAGLVYIRMDAELIEYDESELDEINLAYAISIHKSQGSEFPIVVLPISTQHHALLARHLLYTGITRGKELVVLIGQVQAINRAIDNDSGRHRLTKLAQRIRD